jgi:hypothetical protein
MRARINSGENWYQFCTHVGMGDEDQWGSTLNEISSWPPQLKDHIPMLSEDGGDEGVVVVRK